MKLLAVLATNTRLFCFYRHEQGKPFIEIPVGGKIFFAVLWGVFAVKDDPSRSGKTVIRTPGAIRLLLELLLFGTATCMLLHLGYPSLGWTLGGAVLFHYIISYKRIRWLLKQK